MFRLMIRQAKKHPSLIPLFTFISLGISGAGLYLSRMALFSPDVSWDRKNNPEPWNKLGYNRQYKFIAVNTNYKYLKKNRPDF
ncbi:cytochrome c oxidase subunit NDUFA4-like [Mobula hypostoma]|uniref:cytochrome c oxidase subunit NDUFA4-like n=1 Tax=Mobula hypostoma TaxID=723540 RepID=UPI002FC279F7